MISNRDIFEAITREINRATDMHGPINGLHEGYAIILEEFEEFWDEVKKKQKERHQADWVKELIEVAAMCVRTIQDVTEVDTLEQALRKY